ncbi:tyrosinase [Phlegmacium glaucopus]|nr:tyrosinase [Phlegmacium glaucopus]
MVHSFRFLLVLLWAVSFFYVPVLAEYDYAEGLTNNKCKDLLQRREWRKLSNVEKANYIKAIKCLQSRPPRHQHIEAVKTRFDEFQALHIDVADRVHTTGHFLPWHRSFVRLYENALRDECDYEGATPYWDWTQDVGQSTPFHNSPVFDPATGFGGTGVPGTYTLPKDEAGTSKFFDPESFVGCVADGPFSSYTIRLGPGKLVTDHCLVRGINSTYTRYFSSSAVANATSLPTFEKFRIELEGMPITPTHKMHDGAHLSVGGEMSNFYSSPADPLFYLHHANLDRIWWNWQQMVPSRLYEISGRSTTKSPFQNITLDSKLEMGQFAPWISIREVMDIHQEPFCYTYV